MKKGSNPLPPGAIKPKPPAAPPPVRCSAHIKEIRDTLGCGMHEAMRIVAKQDMLERVERATTIDELREIIKELINEVVR